MVVLILEKRYRVFFLNRSQPKHGPTECTQWKSFEVQCGKGARTTRTPAFDLVAFSDKNTHCEQGSLSPPSFRIPPVMSKRRN